MDTKRVSLADVARMAGVSSNTVSRVVRGDQEVSDATRTRIKELLVELGYKPNLAARALASNRTGVVHVLLAAPMLHGHAHTFLSMVNAASLAGFHVSVSQAATGGVGGRDVLPPIDVDGVIVLGGQEPAVDLASRLGERIPTVLAVTGTHGFERVSTVSVNNVAGARLASEHLIGLGLTDLLHIAGPMDWQDSVERAAGFTDTCRTMGVTSKLVQSTSWDASEGYALAMDLAALPDGVFAANDQLALGVMRAMYERGVPIPEQTRIVGFDDIQGAECYHPPLSSVQQPFTEVGRTAVDLLRELIGGGQARDVLIEPRLVIRASSAE